MYSFQSFLGHIFNARRPSQLPVASSSSKGKSQMSVGATGITPAKAAAEAHESPRKENK